MIDVDVFELQENTENVLICFRGSRQQYNRVRMREVVNRKV